MDGMAFLEKIRYRADMLALIPAHASMGLPLVQKNLWYIPFFHILTEESCVLEAEVFLLYPSGAVAGYQRHFQGKTTIYDGKKLSKQKKICVARLNEGLEVSFSDLEEGLGNDMGEIYKKAAEEMKDDKYKIDL